jgi:hypothetical protein
LIACRGFFNRAFSQGMSWNIVFFLFILIYSSLTEFLFWNIYLTIVICFFQFWELWLQNFQSIFWQVLLLLNCLFILFSWQIYTRFTQRIVPITFIYILNIMQNLMFFDLLIVSRVLILLKWDYDLKINFSDLIIFLFFYILFFIEHL